MEATNIASYHAGLQDCKYGKEQYYSIDDERPIFLQDLTLKSKPSRCLLIASFTPGAFGEAIRNVIVQYFLYSMKTTFS